MVNNASQIEQHTVKKENCSCQYDQHNLQKCFKQYDGSIWRKRTNWSYQEIVRKAHKIARNLKSILDAPFGSGRFCGVLAYGENRVISVCAIILPMHYIDQPSICVEKYDVQ